MYQALIDNQSLKDASLIKNFQVIDTYDEHWSGEEPSILFISKVLVADEGLGSAIEHLKNEWLDAGWYAVLWNEVEVFVVFANHVLKLHNQDPWLPKEINAVIDYGAENDIKEKYFLHIRTAMDAWKIPTK